MDKILTENAEGFVLLVLLDAAAVHLLHLAEHLFIFLVGLKLDEVGHVVRRAHGDDLGVGHGVVLLVALHALEVALAVLRCAVNLTRLGPVPLLAVHIDILLLLLIPPIHLRGTGHAQQTRGPIPLLDAADAPRLVLQGQI